MESHSLNRRHALLSAGGLAVTPWMGWAQESVAPDQGSRPVDSGLPVGWRAIPKIDVHNHIVDPVDQPGVSWQRVENMVIAAQRLGITKLCCSRPITGGRMASIEEVRQANNAVLAAMQKYPQLIAGFCFVQPGNGVAAVDEIRRCVDAGMIGVKLYNQYKYDDPMVFPIAQACIDLKIPWLGHSAHLTDPKSLAAQPNTSDSLVFGRLSLRYPELRLILGHINGGGDWEWAIKGLRDFPNVFLDTSGSVLEDNTIEMCLRELGHHRILFATDQTMEGCVGKILSAQLDAEQREDIFWRNAQRILDWRTS